jgi:hypothetical protein
VSNTKVRGTRESINAAGPSYGPGQPLDIGKTKIDNCPVDGAETPTRSSGPRTQPNSSLGATRVKRYTSPCKA